MSRMLLDREILRAIDDRPPRVGPLSPAEKHFDLKVTAECSKCGLRKLKRYLVEGRFGPQCRLVCGNAPDEFGARDVRTEQRIDALHLPHETHLSKLRKSAAVRAELSLPSERMPAPDNVHVINTCRCCGRADTRATWAELTLLGAKQARDDNDTLIFEEMRNCKCGSTRMVVTTSDGRSYYREGA